jgi:hypothetical protein
VNDGKNYGQSNTDKQEDTKEKCLGPEHEEDVAFIIVDFRIFFL